MPILTAPHTNFFYQRPHRRPHRGRAHVLTWLRAACTVAVRTGRAAGPRARNLASYEVTCRLGRLEPLERRPVRSVQQQLEAAAAAAAQLQQASLAVTGSQLAAAAVNCTNRLTYGFWILRQSMVICKIAHSGAREGNKNNQ